MTMPGQGAVAVRGDGVAAGGDRLAFDPGSVGDDASGHLAHRQGGVGEAFDHAERRCWGAERAQEAGQGGGGHFVAGVGQRLRRHRPSP
jgi:hypothetical protein